MQRYLKVNNKFNWETAPDTRKLVYKIKKERNLDWLSLDNVYFLRSKNSKARAYARIWGLPKIWQETLNVTPKYIIEVLSEKYDKLSSKKKEEILIHELAHIPHNFSGALVPHYRKGKRSFKKRILRIKL